MADWFYVYIQGYLYALTHPEDPNHWRFCEEALKIRDLEIQIRAMRESMPA